MNARFIVYSKDGIYELASVVNSVIFDERLDEQLDTGSIQVRFYKSDDAVVHDFQTCNLMIEQEKRNEGLQSISKWFRSFPSQHKRGEQYYIYSFELVEPTRALMGLTIDGRKVTQPIDGSKKKTLLQVVEGLLDTYHLLKVGEQSKFVIEHSELLYRESPEFHWECGTLLWECLLDIGNVINCIPRLTVNPNYSGYLQSDLNYLVFEKVNDIKGVYEL